VLPQALKNSVPPPKVAVPSESAGTSNPEEPSCLYSISNRCNAACASYEKCRRLRKEPAECDVQNKRKEEKTQEGRTSRSRKLGLTLTAETLAARRKRVPFEIAELINSILNARINKIRSHPNL
jgi:hypothetical protein